MEASSSTSAAEEVARSRDTLSEILFRLPPKSLLQLKLVSKEWRTLISGNRFRRTHHLRHHPAALLLSNKFGPLPHSHILSFNTTTTTATIRPLELDFLNNDIFRRWKRFDTAVVSSCNGLLLCRSSASYFIGNPTTRTFTTLTMPKQRSKSNQFCAFYLAFDPSTSPHHEIVLLRIWGGVKPPFHCVFSVYSSKTRSWRDSAPGVSFNAEFRLNESTGVYSNRAIHWFNKSDDFSSGGVYFDIDARCLRKLPMPVFDYSDSESKSVNRNVKYFGESGGCLHLIIGIKETLKFDVFELKEDYSSWSLIHSVDLNATKLEFPEILHWDMPNSVVPLYIACPSEEKSSVLVLIVGGGLAVLLYDPVDRTSRKLCNLNSGTINVDLATGDVLGEVFQYFEYSSC